MPFRICLKLFVCVDYLVVESVFYVNRPFRKKIFTVKTRMHSICIVCGRKRANRIIMKLQDVKVPAWLWLQFFNMMCWNIFIILTRALFVVCSFRELQHFWTPNQQKSPLSCIHNNHSKCPDSFKSKCAKAICSHVLPLFLLFFLTLSKAMMLIHKERWICVVLKARSRKWDANWNYDMTCWGKTSCRGAIQKCKNKVELTNV